jgi:hypothetical protein
VPHLLPVGQGKQAMPSWAEVLGDGTIDGQEPLSVSWGLESPHAPLPLAGRSVRVFCPVAEVSMLVVFHLGASTRLAAP